MNRFFTSVLLLLAGTLVVPAQFAQFPGTSTTFLRGDNTWATPTTFGAVSATTIAASGAQTNSSTLGVAGAVTMGSTLAVTGAQTNSSTLGVAGATTLGGALGVTGATTLSGTLAANGRSTFGAGVTLTRTTLVPASGGTNYGIDMALYAGAYKSMTNHVAFTGVTNNALGAQMSIILYNGSGGNLDVRFPTGSLWQYAAPFTVTNTAVALVEVYGMGTASTNALWRVTPFIP